MNVPNPSPNPTLRHAPSPDTPETLSSQSPPKDQNSATLNNQRDNQRNKRVRENSDPKNLPKQPRIEPGNLPDSSPVMPTLQEDKAQGVHASIHAPRNTILPEPINEVTMEEDSDDVTLDPATRRIVKNNRITTKKGLTYTAPPKEDFPVPQLTRSVTHGLASCVLEHIENLNDYKIWVRPWMMRYTPDLQIARQLILKTLNNFLDRDKPVNLIQPTAEAGKQTSKDGNPWHFLVTDLTKTEYDWAVKTRVIASKVATIFILPFEQPIPSFVMQLKDITYDEGQESEGIARVTSEVKKELKAKMTTIEANLARYIQDPAESAKELAAFIEGISTTLVAAPEIPSSPFWCISSANMPNFTDIDAYNEFMKGIKELNFHVLGFGIGTPTEGFTCVKCKSRDHPTTQCPFPSIPGWLFPKEEDFPWTKQEHGAKGGRGGRAGQSGGRGIPSQRASKTPATRRNV